METITKANLLSIQTMINSVPMIHGQNDLLAFIKILFLFLKKDRQEVMIREAKRVLIDCAATRRLGATTMSLVPCLMYAMEHHVRLIVGEAYWLRSKVYFVGYKQRHLRRQVLRAQNVINV